MLGVDIVDSAEIEARSEIEGALEESVVVFEIVMERQMFGDEGQLRLRDLAAVVVVEGELELGEIIEELQRQLVEEDGALAVEL